MTPAEQWARSEVERINATACESTDDLFAAALLLARADGMRVMLYVPFPHNDYLDEINRLKSLAAKIEGGG